MAAIIVKLHGGLIPRGPSLDESGKIRLDLTSGESVRDVVARLGIPEVKIHLAFVGRERVTMDSILKDGDTLNLFPPMAGG